jgi:hypothetical protein
MRASSRHSFRSFRRSSFRSSRRFSYPTTIETAESIMTTGNNSLRHSRTEEDLMLSLTVELLYFAERLGNQQDIGNPEPAPQVSDDPFLVPASSPISPRRLPLIRKNTRSTDLLLSDESPNPYLSPSLYSQGSPSSPVPRAGLLNPTFLFNGVSSPRTPTRLSRAFDRSPTRRQSNWPRNDLETDVESPGQALRRTASLVSFRTHLSQLDYTLFDIPEASEEGSIHSRERKISFSVASDIRLRTSPLKNGSPSRGSRMGGLSSPLREGENSITNLGAHLDTLYRIDLDLPSYTSVSAFRDRPLLKYGFDLCGDRGSYSPARWGALPSLSPSPYCRPRVCSSPFSPSIATLLAREENHRQIYSLLRESVSLPSLPSPGVPIHLDSTLVLPGGESTLCSRNLLNEKLDLPSIAFGSETSFDSLSPFNQPPKADVSSATCPPNVGATRLDTDKGKNTITFPSVAPASMHPRDTSSPRRSTRPALDIGGWRPTPPPKDWIIRRCPWLAEDCSMAGSSSPFPPLGAPPNRLQPLSSSIGEPHDLDSAWEDGNFLNVREASTTSSVF